MTHHVRASLSRWLLVVALSPCVHAQTATPNPAVSYELRIYSPGVDPANGEPLSRSTIPALFVTCNRPQTVFPAVAVNPRRVLWADPDHPGKDCGVELPAFFSAVPPAAGPYLATLTAIDAFGSRSESSQPSNIFFRTSAAGLAAAQVRKDR